MLLHNAAHYLATVPHPTLHEYRSINDSPFANCILHVQRGFYLNYLLVVHSGRQGSVPNVVGVDLLDSNPICLCLLAPVSPFRFSRHATCTSHLPTDAHQPFSVVV